MTTTLTTMVPGALAASDPAAASSWERWAWQMVFLAEDSGGITIAWQTLADIDRAATADAQDEARSGVERARLGRLAVRARFAAHLLRSPLAAERH